jgi:hypothetical protein
VRLALFTDETGKNVIALLSRDCHSVPIDNLDLPDWLTWGLDRAERISVQGVRAALVARKGAV